MALLDTTHWDLKKVEDGTLGSVYAGPFGRDNLDTIDPLLGGGERTSGENVSARDALYLSAANTVKKAQADAASTMPVVGFAQTTVTSGNPVKVQTHGVMTGFAGLTAGATYYLDTAIAGGITSVKPSYRAQKIGIAKSTTELEILLGSNMAHDSAFLIGADSAPTVGVDQVGVNVEDWAAGYASLRVTGEFGAGSAPRSIWLRGDFVAASCTNISHGMTDLLPDSIGFGIGLSDASNGGVAFTSLTEGDQNSMILNAVQGAASPTTPAMLIRAGKKNGTTWQALGASEKAFQFQNYTTKLMTMLGSGAIYFGIENPTVADDIVINPSAVDKGLCILEQGDDTRRAVELLADASGGMIGVYAGGSKVISLDGQGGKSYVNAGANFGINTNDPGADCDISGSASTHARIGTTAQGSGTILSFLSDRTTSDVVVGTTQCRWGTGTGTLVADIRFLSGADTTNKDEGRIELRTAAPGGTMTGALKLDEYQNVLLSGLTSRPTSMVGGLAMQNQTAPSGNITDGFSMYSGDQAAGNACPHFRTESGQIVKLYQQSNISDPSGGGTVDTEARTAINSILDLLENNGLMST